MSFLISCSGFATDLNVFTLTSTVKPSGLQLHWDISSDAYLYKNTIKVLAVNPENTHIGVPTFPEGEIKHTELFGDVTIYHRSLDVNIPIENLSKQSYIKIKVSYQGCSDSGQCYTPVTEILKLDFSPASQLTKTKASTNISFNAQKIEHNLSHYSVITMVFLFLALGVFLALTPCILPMIPILSGIILQETHYSHQGKTQIKKHKALFLSLSYVLGISTAYALLGFLMSSLGNHVQIFFQNPIILVLFGFIFILLALSLFGLFDFKLLDKTNHKIAHFTHQLSRIASKNYLTVSLMGFLSALVISPCVTPPLVGVLAYIASTGNVIMGTLLLFSMGFGMGIPLLIIGVLETKFLPKAGAWMEAIKLMLGLMLLGMAVVLWQRVIPATQIPLLWGVFIILICILLFFRIQLKTKFMRIIFHTMCFLGILYGALPLIEQLTGNTLFYSKKISTFQIQTKPYILAENVKQLTDYLAEAKANHKPVMLDFYADWCLDCRSMESAVFNQADILEQLNRFVWIKVDMTQDNPAIWALEQKYSILGPPTFLFYDAEGEPLNSSRFVGFKSHNEILSILKTIK